MAVPVFVCWIANEALRIAVKRKAHQTNNFLPSVAGRPASAMRSATASRERLHYS